MIVIISIFVADRIYISLELLFPKFSGFTGIDDPYEPPYSCEVGIYAITCVALVLD